MDIKQIEERIEKKKAQIAKIQKRVDKWEKAISDTGFKKEYKWDCRDGFYWNREACEYNMTYEQFKADRFEEYAASCRNEIRYATRDLEEANIQLQKYFNALKMEQVKQDKLNAERIKVIVDFLEAWKVKVTDYIHENVKIVKKYYEANSKCCKLHNEHYWLISNGTYASEEEFKEAYKAANEEYKMLKMMVDDLAMEVYDRNAENLTDDVKLKNILDKEADNKYLKMIDAITAKVGEITDSSSLSIGVKGDIEGYITGTTGKVHIQTIGAGGYNIQCYHFRTLYTPVKA